MSLRGKTRGMLLGCAIALTLTPPAVSAQEGTQVAPPVMQESAALERRDVVVAESEGVAQRRRVGCQSLTVPIGVRVSRFDRQGQAHDSTETPFRFLSASD